MMLMAPAPPPSLDDTKFSHIICHRGLHDDLLDQVHFDGGRSQTVTKEQLKFPVENTLQAYTKAWELGFNMVECDVTTSTDEQVFLCHDETFERVGASDDPLAKMKASKLSMAEVEQLHLRDGSHPPKLIACLEAARLFSTPESKKMMVIELKQDGLFPTSSQEDGEEAAANLASARRMVNVLTRMFDSDPSLLDHVALLFSFGPEVMRWLAQWKASTGANVQLLQLVEGTKWMVQNKTLRIDLESLASMERAIANVREVGLDGLYLEFQDEMLEEESEVQKNLKFLCREMVVGIWMYETQPDGLAPFPRKGKPVFQVLVELGVKYVNANIKRED